MKFLDLEMDSKLVCQVLWTTPKCPKECLKKDTVYTSGDTFVQCNKPKR